MNTHAWQADLIIDGCPLYHSALYLGNMNSALEHQNFEAYNIKSVLTLLEKHTLSQRCVDG